jgi:hypothetical protein
VPITNSEKSVVDKKIIGKWFGSEIGNDGIFKRRNDFFFEVLDFNSKEYLLLLTSSDGSMPFKMFSSKIKDKLFYNVCPIGNVENEKPGWLFFTIESLGAEEGKIRFINDLLKKKFTKSKDLEKYLSKNYDLLMKEWLATEDTFYREEFFIWDKVNKLKTKDLSEAHRMADNYEQTKDKSFAQLSESSKNTLDNATTAYLLSNSYQAFVYNKQFNPKFTIILKFNNGSGKILDFGDENIFYDRESGFHYKLKPGIDYPKN